MIIVSVPIRRNFMKAAISPLVTAAIAAALALATFATSVPAQETTTEDNTVVEKSVILKSGHRKETDTTEIQFQPASTADDINMQMLHDFGEVKQTDRKVATDIARHPEVVDNASYVAKHPALQAFLEKYPAAHQEIVESPGNFVTPVAGSKWNSHEAAGIPRD
jgi:hypothetical protein